MAVLLLKLFLAPALVVASTLAGRRWGPGVAGVLVGLPIVAGPILFITYLQNGADFAAGAARSTLLGLVSLAAFAVVFTRTGRRFAWLTTLLATWAVVLAVDTALSAARFPLPASLACTLAATALAYALMPRTSRKPPPAPADPAATPPTRPGHDSAPNRRSAASPRPPACDSAPGRPSEASPCSPGPGSVPDRPVAGSPCGSGRCGAERAVGPGRRTASDRSVAGSSVRPAAHAEPEAARPPAWDLPGRAVATGVLVLAVTTASTALGPEWTGILAPFPIATSVVAAFVLAQRGPVVTARTLDGTLMGLFAFAVFCLVLVALVRPLGAVAYAVAVPVTVAAQLLTGRVRTALAARNA